MKIPHLMLKTAQIPLSAKRDALLIPILFLINSFLYSSWHRLIQGPAQWWLPLVWLYGLVGLVPLIWRDRYPVIVFATQWVLTAAAWQILPYYTPFAGIVLALYAVSVYRSWKVSLPALLVSFIPLGLDAIAPFRFHQTFEGGFRAFIDNVIFFVPVVAGTWGLGRVTQAVQKHIKKLEDERQETRRAVAAERQRIAQELHDIVAHAVTVMVLQAGGAARVVKTDSDKVIRLLADVETYGRQAVAELRRLLSVLEGAGRGELKPQPGLTDLDDLLSSLRATGMVVTVHVEGTPRDLDPSVDLAAYRIAQEALTNILKHAGTDTNPRLRIAWQAESLHLEVTNDTDPAANTQRRSEMSCGRGLLGLQERVRAVGGHLHAGPQPSGYRLTATLPLANTAQPILLNHQPNPSSMAEGSSASEQAMESTQGLQTGQPPAFTLILEGSRNPHCDRE